MRLAKVLVPFLSVCLLTSGCGVLMAASRSSYRGDINILKIGIPRSAVIAELGEPDNFTTLDNGGYDDRYTLDPDAHRIGTKILTVIFYLAADIFTLFLTELLWTPTEIALKDRIVIYHLTYGPDGKLSLVEKLKP
jgi:hypothetical protein